MSPQTLQTAMPTAGYAYAGAANAHTGLHQALHELRHGGSNAKK
jgi:hypothetical protein